MSFSPQDLAFSSGEARKVEVISAISGVPVTMLKANDPNLASAREGSLGFLRNTVRPYLTLDEAFLNRQLLPLFGQYADQLFLAYDDPVAEDKQMQATIDASDASSGIRTRNEIRSARGLEAVEGGDELLVPAGTVPIDVAIEQARNPQPMFGAFATEPAELKADKCPEGSHWMQPDEIHAEGWCMKDEAHETYSAKESTETKHAKDCGCSNSIVSCQKSLFENHRSLIGVKRAPIDTNNADYNRVIRQNEQYIETFFDGLTSVFSDQVNNFLDTGMSDIALWGDHAVSRLEGLSKDFVKEVMKQSGQQELDRLVPDLELKFDFLDPNLLNALEDYTSQLNTTLKEGTQRELDRRIATGVRNGLSTDDIRRSIQDLLVEEPDTGIIPIRARAEMIARTEVAMIHEEAKFQAWKESGVVEKKQWQVSAGACESCRTLAVMQPSPIPLDEPFAVAGQQVGKIRVWRTMQTAPLHPNCRCGTIEILGDETQEELEFLGL
jgi:hypothetical protein